MSRPHTFRTRLAVAAVTAPLALALVACGDDDSDDANDSDDTTAQGTVTPAPEGSSPSATDSPAAAQAGGDALRAAALTGLGSVDGGTVFSVDRQDTGGWEVSVVTADGTELDVPVSEDGSATTGDPVEEPDDGDDSVSDPQERQRLLDVPVDYLAAIDAAEGSATAGELTGVDLDEDNGAATWEVQYGEDTPDELTVVVDASTGEVLRTETDD
jgi:hypothetical protein